MKTALALATTLIVLAGCASVGNPVRSGLKASGFASTDEEDARPASGIIGGGLIGSAVGNGLGRSARHAALEAEYRALETAPAGEAVTWGETATGGAVVAAQPYRVGSQDCRQYTQSVRSSAGTRSASGTACRNGDGSWTVLN